MPKAVAQKLIPVVVTTKHRGVFFGYAEPFKGVPAELRIEKARMCQYWSSDVRGVVGLAVGGPTKNCKIGLAAPAITLNDITSIMECSDDAAASWEKGPWA